MLLRAACVRLCSSAAGATEEKAARDVMMPRTVGQHDGYCCSANRRRIRQRRNHNNPEDLSPDDPKRVSHAAQPQDARCPQRDTARREATKGQKDSGCI